MAASQVIEPMVTSPPGEDEMGDSQTQKAGEGVLQIQAGGNVTITIGGVSYTELDLKIAEAGVAPMSAENISSRQPCVGLGWKRNSDASLRFIIAWPRTSDVRDGSFR